MADPKPITIQFTIKNITRFWSKVNVATNQGPQNTCWEWRGSKYSEESKFRYGLVKIQRQVYTASRIAYILCYGEDPYPFQVGHHCDNPPCCRPDHLFKTSPKGNSEDMVKKGRCKSSKLTANDVSKIRELYATGHYSFKKLAKVFHISKTTIVDITMNRTWKHIT